MTTRVKDIILIASFIVFGVLTRTVWHVAPNVEFVTAFSIAGAYFIRKKYSLVIPLGIMIFSDFIIGNTAIYLFTWSAFGVAWMIGRGLRSRQFKTLFGKLPRILRLGVISEVGGLIFTLFFFLWTNFGVVVVSDLYPKTFEGLILSYKMGLPFLIPQLVGNMIIIPSIFILTKIIYKDKLNVLTGIRYKMLNRK